MSKKIIYTGAKISKFNNSSYCHINKSNTLLLMGSYLGIFLIDLNKTWVDVPAESNNQIIISPNPTNGILVLTNPQNHQISTLTAFDILGRTYPLSSNGNEVDVSALAAGRYFLKVGLADGSFLDFGFIKGN